MLSCVRMLDPRILAARRDEIVESCRRRRVTADVDGAIRAQEQLAAAQTALGEANRLRNEHQASGKRKLEGAEREVHVAEGRRLKDEVAGLEAALNEAQGVLDAAIVAIPNLVHAQTPEGGEADFREACPEYERLHQAFLKKPQATFQELVGGIGIENIA